jgi:PhnB protein
MHARLMVNDEVLMGCDAFPGSYAAPKGFSVSINLIRNCVQCASCISCKASVVSIGLLLAYGMQMRIKDQAQAERIFTALSVNEKVDMLLQKTFWAKRFGMLVDQFGIPWMINCEKGA